MIPPFTIKALVLGTVKAVALLGLIAVVLADLVPQILRTGLAGTALLAGGVAGLGYLLRIIHRSVKHGRAFTAHAREGIDTIQTLPERLDSIDSRLDTGDARMGEIERILGVVADADRERIHDRLAAGEQRNPVDRRRRAA